ncbi:hypothetical protein [Falsiroseomonas sp.]|uniref:hypothetical protein n=1 Tax=Falsiroseomonas sp. TaxID=2870721 RepID=UPI003567F9DD
MSTDTRMARTRLTRKELAAELTARGYPIAADTLAQHASRGTGPGFVIFGRTALYDLDRALAWAEARERRPRSAARAAAGAAA